MLNPVQSLAGRTVLVTGAARGVGRAIAEACAAAGARLILADILAEALQNAEAGIVTNGAGKTPVGKGLSKRARQRAAVEMVREQAERDFEADKPTPDETTVGA